MYNYGVVYICVCVADTAQCILKLYTYVHIEIVQNTVLRFFVYSSPSHSDTDHLAFPDPLSAFSIRDFPRSKCNIGGYGFTICTIFNENFL